MELERLRQEYQHMNIPAEGLERMRQSIDRAKTEKRRINRRNRIRHMGMAVAAALVIAVALPNMNADIAYAMERIPVLGAFFKVVTLRDYEYEDDSHSAEVRVPQVQVEGQVSGAAAGEPSQLDDSVDKINLDIEKVTQELVDSFKASVEADGEGHSGLYVDHEVVTDNERWFTLRLIVVETQGSGYEYYKYYTVDKSTGLKAELKDLFTDGCDYIGIISEDIKAQMRARMETDENVLYFLDTEEAPDTEFSRIKEDQNFYIDSEGNLTVVFDEYEVAPGYMGPQQFTVSREAVADILK